MKCFLTKVVLVVLAIGVSTVMAEDRVAPTSSTPNNAQVGKLSPGQTAIQQATATNKYAFIFFWKQKSAQTDKAYGVAQAAVAKWADTAELVSIQATDAAEKAVVDQYGVSRAPMPMVLAVSPCGAITKACTGAFDESQLREAFVSPCTAECMKALQAQKLVLLCVQPKSAEVQQVSLQKGVKDFTEDKEYAAYSKVLSLNASDPAEAKFLTDLNVDAKTAAPVTVLIAPPAAVVGAFTGDVTKEQLVAKLKAAQSGCCPGGKCGPGGCCPKK